MYGFKSSMENKRELLISTISAALAGYMLWLWILNIWAYGSGDIYGTAPPQWFAITYIWLFLLSAGVILGWRAFVEAKYLWWLCSLTCLIPTLRVAIERGSNVTIVLIVLALSACVAVISVAIGLVGRHLRSVIRPEI